jgi:hypothetical protein
VGALVAALMAAGAGKVFRDTASAARTGRARLRRVLDQLDAGGVLMVMRADRLARSTRDPHNTLAVIAEGKAGFRSSGAKPAKLVAIKPGTGYYRPYQYLSQSSTMTIEISRDTETRLADEARRRGISVDALLKQFINERAALTNPAQCQPQLPVWHLGSVGALHRRDIYDDVR